MQEQIRWGLKDPAAEWNRYELLRLYEGRQGYPVLENDPDRCPAD